VGSQIQVVKGRLLPAPTLEYGKPTSYNAGTQGAWNMEGVRACRSPPRVARLP